MIETRDRGDNAARGHDLQRHAATAGEHTPELVEQILALRAARLAEVLADHEPGEQMSILLVRLGRELYGLDAHCVDRVQPVEQITRVPRVPDWVAGVTNLRGRLLSVVNLVRYFGLPTDAPESPAGQSQACLVVVNTSEMELALLVDDVLTVENIPTSRLQEAGGIVRGLRPEYVRGIAQRDTDRVRASDDRDDLAVVLDLGAILSDERLVVHEEI